MSFQRLLQNFSIWLFRKSFGLQNNKNVKREEIKNGSTKNFK